MIKPEKSIIFSFSTDHALRRILLSWCQDFGLRLTDAQIHLLGVYVNELWEWNRRFNLIGVSSREKVVNELLLDSLIPAAFLREHGRLLDVGSGAGFPAIPLKICRPQLTVHFMEANAKKSSFLKHVARLLGFCQVRVITGRIERDRGLLHEEGYHVITARAVAQLPQAMAWCSPALMAGGLFVTFQGGQLEEVMDPEATEGRAYGLFLRRCIQYELPAKGSSRYILIFEKKE
jgi:16S rRNA (guanine527-N7)-methyltransferase